MKKFKTKYNKGNNYYLIIVVIIILVALIINFYNKKLSNKLLDIAETKIEEITNIYVKKDIVPKNVDLNKLIIVEKNSNEEIITVDIDHNYANEIMMNVITKIQNNIFEFNFDDSLLKENDGSIYIETPLFLAYDGVLLSNLGPKIPIKLTFYEHAFGNIKVELIDYGINNALIKIFLEVYLEQKIYMPYKEVNKTKKFDLIIGSKIITGKVPSIYGGMFQKSENLTNT